MMYCPCPGPDHGSDHGPDHGPDHNDPIMYCCQCILPPQLHQYPGYDSSELNLLPNDISALDILTRVTNAQPKLKNKVS